MSFTRLATRPITISDKEKALIPLLVKRAEYALVSGVHMNLTEYEALTDAEHVAFAIAGERLNKRTKVEDSIRSAVAHSGPLGPPLVRAELDGGDSLARAVVDLAAEVAANAD